MNGYFLTIPEAKKDARLKISELDKKIQRIEAFVLKNPDDIHARKRLKSMHDHTEYLKSEIEQFSEIEKIIGVNREWSGGMDL